MLRKHSQASTDKKRPLGMTERSLGRTPTVDVACAKEVAELMGQHQLSAVQFRYTAGLDALAKQHVSSFAKLVDRNRLAPGRTITVGTACTGSAADKFSFEAMEKAFQTEVPGFRIRFVFNCEIVTWKQQFIRRIHLGYAASEDELKGDPTSSEPCMFGDIVLLGGADAHCYTHGGKCPVQGVDLFVVCTSCKDYSKANSTLRVGHVITQQTSTGGSAQTLRGMLDYIDAHRPGMIIFENVDAIDDSVRTDLAGLGGKSEFSDMDLICAEWANRGYEAQRVHVNTESFGLPTVRRRLVASGVLTIANPSLCFKERDTQAVFRTMRSLLGVCPRRCASAADYILPQYDTAVERELQRRVAKGAKNVPYNIGNAMKAASGLGVKWGTFPPQQALAQSPWYMTLTAEQRDALCFSLHYHPNPLLLRDCGQSLNRVRVSTIDVKKNHLAPTMMPKQLCMVFDQVQPPRLLLGRESLWVQGFPIGDEDVSHILDTVSEAHLADLAGNMVSTPVFLGLVMASIAALPWRSTEASATELSATLKGENENAMDSFALCAGLPLPPPPPQQSSAGGPLLRRFKAARSGLGPS